MCTWEATQMSTDDWMDKQNVVQSRILFSFKGEGNSLTCYHMDELWGYYAYLK